MTAGVVQALPGLAHLPVFFCCCFVIFTMSGEMGKSVSPTDTEADLQ